MTPPYPDYPCALPSLTGAATSVLREFFGTDDIGFTVTFNAASVTLPEPMPALPAKSITRVFTSLSQAAEEAQSARVYAGLHFREGCAAGGQQGNNRPLRDRARAATGARKVTVWTGELAGVDRASR